MRTWNWLLFVGVLTGCSEEMPPFYEPPLPEEEEDATVRMRPLIMIASVLDGLRWEMPCASPPIEDYKCAPSQGQFSDVSRLAGSPGEYFNVRLRFRGVVELESYTGGMQDDFWYHGGTPDNSNYNVYSLQVSSPPQIYYLNAGEAGIHRSFAIDYEKTLVMEGGAGVTLSADAQDGALILNQDESGEPIVIPDVDPYPQPFNGQFIQMDLLSEEPMQ